MEEFPKGHEDTDEDEHSVSSVDGLTIKEDYPGFGGHAVSNVLDFKGGWDEHFPLTEFAYNNSYQASIQMTPYEALYGRPRRSPVCWMEVGERHSTGPDLIRDTSEKVDWIRKLKSLS